MRRKSITLPVLLAVLLVAGCAGARPETAPAPAGAPDPVGTYEFTALSADGSETATGTMRIEGEPGAHRGVIRSEELPEDSPIRSVVVHGNQITVTGATPIGSLTLAFELEGATFTGRWSLGPQGGELRGRKQDEAERASPGSSGGGAAARAVQVSNVAAGMPGLRELDGLLHQLADAEMLSGVVLVGKEGRPALEFVRGIADRGAGVPNRPDTRFNLASLNKMFTGVAIAQLAERGKLSFEDPIVKHLPDYPNGEVARQVSIHHLLTHTSGMGDYFGPQFAERRADLRQLADYLPLFAERPLRFTPAERWAYSNAGYLVLGRIIEEVSGESYHEYVGRHIFEPAGMNGTGFYDPERELPKLAIGYTSPAPREEPFTPTTDRWEPVGSSAGGGFSTAGDLLRFAEALRTHRLLGPEHTRLVTTGKVRFPLGMYAYGFGILERGGEQVFGHHGGVDGGAADLEVNPRTGEVLVILLNSDSPHLASNREELRALMWQRIVAATRAPTASGTSDAAAGHAPPVPAASGALHRYTGSYRFPSGAELRVEAAEEALQVEATTEAVRQQLSRFPEPASGAALRTLAPRVTAVLAGFSRDDYEPLRRELGRALDFEEEQRFWAWHFARWEARHGKLAGVELLGGAPLELPQGRFLDVYVRARFATGDELLMVRQDGEGGLFLQAFPLPVLPAVHRFRPTAANEFSSRNYLLGTEVRLRFRTDPAGSVTGLELPDGGMVARRVG